MSTVNRIEDTVNRIVDDAGNVIIDLNSTTVCVDDRMGAMSFGQSTDGVAVRTMTVIFSANDNLTRMAEITTLKRALVDAARESRTAHVPNWYWWEFYESDANEYPKRALIYGGVLQASGTNYPSSIPVLGRAATIMELALTIGPWESTIAETLTLTISPEGGAATLPPMGDIDGRIAEISFAGRHGEAIAMGILRGAENTGFSSSHWKIQGTPPYQFSYAATDTTYSKVSSSFATAFGSDDATHWRGRYLVIPNYSATSQVTIAIMRFMWDTYSATTALAWKPIIPSGTSYTKLGVVDFPPGLRGYDHPETLLDNLLYKIETQLKSGTVTATLDLEGLYFIPADHYLILGNTTMAGSAAEEFFVDVLPNGVIEYVEDTSITDNRIPRYNIDIESRAWQYPAEGGQLTIAMINNGGFPVNSSDLTVNVTVYPRWAEYRTRDV